MGGQPGNQANKSLLQQSPTCNETGLLWCPGRTRELDTARDHRVEHARNAGVNAEFGGAVGLRGAIEAVHLAPYNGEVAPISRGQE